MTDNQPSYAPALRALFSNDSCIDAIIQVFGELGEAKQATAHSVLERSQEKSWKHSRRDIVRAMGTLANLGVGKFVVGRRGSPTRFVCEEPLANIMKIVIDEIRLENSRDADNEAALFAKHVFRLRPDLNVMLQLPDNLTDHEAERLATFVRALPIG